MTQPVEISLPILQQLQKGKIPVNPKGLFPSYVGLSVPSFVTDPGSAPAGYVYQSRAAYDVTSAVQAFRGPAVSRSGRPILGRSGPIVYGRVRFTAPAVSHSLTALPGTLSRDFASVAASLAMVLSIPIVGPVVDAVGGFIGDTVQAAKSALTGGTGEGTLLGGTGSDVLAAGTATAPSAAGTATAPSTAEAVINLGAEPYEAYLPYAQQGELAQAATRASLPWYQSLATDPVGALKDAWQTAKSYTDEALVATLGAETAAKLESGTSTLFSTIGGSGTSTPFSTIGGGTLPGGPPPPAGLFPVPPGIPSAPVSFAGGAGGGGFYSATATSPANASLTPWMVGLALLGILVTIYVSHR